MSESKNYSVLDQLQRKLDEGAAERMSRLSALDLKAVMTWMESRQLQIAMGVATEDDPVRNAKGRGQVELLDDLAAELFSYLGQIAAKKAPEQRELDDDGV